MARVLVTSELPPGSLDPILDAGHEIVSRPEGELRDALGDVDALRHQMADLEERVDFAERLLAQTHDPQSKVLRGGTS